MKKLTLIIICILIIPIVYGALGEDLINSGSWVFDDIIWSQSGNDFSMSAFSEDFGIADLSQTVATVASPKEYRLTYEIVDAIGDGGSWLQVNFAGNNNLELIQDGDSGLRSFDITASSSADLEFVFDVAGGGSEFSATINNIVVQEILPDSCVVDGVVSTGCTTTEDETISGDVLVDGVTWTVRGATVNIDG